MTTTPENLQELSDKRMIDQLDPSQILTLMSIRGENGSYTAKEAALYLDYKIRTFQNLHAKKTFRYTKRGGKVYFPKKSLDEWMSKNPRMSEDDIDEESLEVLHRIETRQ